MNDREFDALLESAAPELPPDELVNDQAVRKIYLGENFRM